MKKLWNNFGDRYFSKLEHGNLKVTYNDGLTKWYGDEQGEEISLKILNHAFFRKIIFYGDIGFCESYMDGDFECNDLTKLIELALVNSSTLQTKSEHEKDFGIYNLFPFINKIRHKMRKNSKTKARKNISDHYDLSNDFFELMLDDTMMYSSAVFSKQEESLYEAQQRKIEILANKLGLQKGSKVLEIGSGWGAMALHLAKVCGCEVTTLTLSKEQKKTCEQRFKEHDVNECVDVMLQDYRDMQGEFDAIISIEMFEAVGKEYFDIFFTKCQELLKPSGKLVMQVITMPDERYDAYCKGTDFIQKYIFPGGHLPSVEKILSTTSKYTNLNLLHMEEFTEHYAKTLNIWQQNFNKELESIKRLGFDEYFIRMWKMYLSYCEAAFLTKNTHLVQLVFTRNQSQSNN